MFCYDLMMVVGECGDGEVNVSQIVVEYDRFGYGYVLVWDEVALATTAQQTYM